MRIVASRLRWPYAGRRGAFAMEDEPMSIQHLPLAFIVCLVATVSFGDETLDEFLRRRDEWLSKKAADEVIESAPQRFPTPIADALVSERERLNEKQRALDPILERIEKNKSKSSLAVLVKKDQERAAPIKGAIEGIQRRIADLEAKLSDEEKEKAEFDKAQVAVRKQKHAKYLDRLRQHVDETRNDMNLMPPDLPKLTQDNFKAGRFGLLPQWPPAFEIDHPLAQKAVENACRAVVGGRELTVYEMRAIDQYVPGGMALARKRHNLKIIQVFDKRHLLVSVIGGDSPAFLMNVGDTSNYADGSTILMATPVVVTGTHHYPAVSGASRTAFVVRVLNENDLPEYGD